MNACQVASLTNLQNLFPNRIHIDVDVLNVQPEIMGDLHRNIQQYLMQVYVYINVYYNRVVKGSFVISKSVYARITVRQFGLYKKTLKIIGKF